MGTGARRKAPEPDVAAAVAAAGAAARQRERSRRRRRAAMKSPDHGYRYEFLGQESGGTATHEGKGAGTLGFAGAASSGTAVEAGGLATLAGDGFGGGPSVPMVPGTWAADDTA